MEHRLCLLVGLARTLLLTRQNLSSCLSMSIPRAHPSGGWSGLLQYASEIQGLVAVHVARRFEEYGEVGLHRKLAHLRD